MGTGSSALCLRHLTAHLTSPPPALGLYIPALTAPNVPAPVNKRRGREGQRKRKKEREREREGGREGEKKRERREGGGGGGYKWLINSPPRAMPKH